MKKQFLSIFFLTAFLAGAADLTVSQLDFDSTPEAQKRYLAQPYSWWGRGKYPVKKDERGKIVVLSNSRTRYVFFLFGKYNSKGEWFPDIGMVKPSKANWAAGGFISFTSGKIKAKQCAVTVSDIKDGGFTLNYKGVSYTARCRLELKKDDDRLYLLFDAPSQTTVQLTAYPSSYAGSFSRGLKLRKRFAVTPKQRIPMGRSVTLAPEEYYVFLGDSWFDPGSNRGEGPCAVIFDPAKTRCRVSVQNYNCLLQLTGKGAMPFILFDFNGTSNAEAERIMRELPVKFN